METPYRADNLTGMPLEHYMGRLKTADASEISARLGLEWDGRGFTLKVLGEDRHINFPAFDDEGWTDRWRILFGRYLLEVYFNSKPALAGKLRELAKEGLKKLAEEGPTDEQFAKTVENFKKNLPENRISNAWWHRNLVNFYRTGRDNDKETEAAVAGLSKAGIQAAAKALLESGNFIEVVMEPGQTAEAE